jgi:spore germination cell wall hydrolase CwlJ-like protein
MAKSGRRYVGKAAARRRARREAVWQLLVVGAVAVVATMAVTGRWPRTMTPPNVAKPMTMAAARVSNAAVPIDRNRRMRAASFHLRTAPTAVRQAAECLATAALYEAGDDKRGQQAVMQVILNRVRTPGFPRTVCGVVYQGSTRATGCQFSFTCDGSVQRRPVRSGWAAARRRARTALSGRVDEAVGRATHYHADWLVPYWRDSMVKIARVGTHLFYVRRNRAGGLRGPQRLSQRQLLPSGCFDHLRSRNPAWPRTQGASV